MRYLSFLLSLLFACCQNETPHNQLVVVFPETPLRESPGTKSKVLGTLAPGEPITDMQEVSRFESVLYFNDQRHQSPWMQVRTADQKTGWVFCDAVRPAQSNPDWNLQQRLKCYFGDAVTGRRNQFVRTAPPDDPAARATFYREAMALRDTMVYLLSRRPEPEAGVFQPDFSWLGEVLPHFVYQTMAGSEPCLFADYRYWYREAAQRGNAAEIAFFNACLTAFAADSIESSFPVWKFQITDREAVSQLGKRHHLAMLEAIQSAMDAGSLFRPELVAFKESLLADILDKDMKYWQPKELIIKELEEIISGNFGCLDDTDRASIRARMAMFENPEANGIKVNLRSGE